MVVIHTFPSGPFATNAYLVAEGESGPAVIIDPAPGSAASILKVAGDNRYRIKKIILTHSHWDHIADLATLVEALDVPVWVHSEDEANVLRPGSDGLPMLMPIASSRVDHRMEEGEEFTVGTLLFKVLHLPGHSPGGVGLYEAREGILFSGDTLFAGSIGTLALPTAEPDRMGGSLDRLAKLPPETRVYPGHGEPTTLAKESWLPNAREIFGIEG